jgi:hypothetical protein
MPEWQRMPINRRCEVDLARDVYFVDGARSEHVRRPDLRQQLYDKVPRVHEDGTPVSVCYAFVNWLGVPFPDKNAVHAMYANIEMWSAPWGDLYLYRTARKPQPCQQATLNWLDPDLAAKIQHWRMECLVEDSERIRKVVVNGPLSFQEPPDSEAHVGLLSSILRLGNVVELPSVESQTLARAYESATGFTIMWGTGNERYYVPNLPAIPTIRAEEVRIGAPSVEARTPDRWLWPVLKLVDAGVLTVRKMVFKYGNADNFQDTTRMITDPMLQASGIPVYIAVDSVNDDLLREIESTGVRNFILPERFPPMSQADQVISRPFYRD